MLDAWVSRLPDACQTFLAGGYVAVGTFFVLSGFVLGRSYGGASWDRKSLVRYGIARWARVYPVYALSLLIIAPIVWSDLVSARAGVGGGALLNYGLVLQGWVNGTPVNWNTPAWSLTCELFFYLCFPVLAFAMRGMSRRSSLAAALLALLLPLGVRWLDVPLAWKPILHLADFVLGIACALLYEWLSRSWLAGRGYWLYLPAVCLAVLATANPLWFTGWLTLNSVLRPLNALLLLGLAAGGGVPVRVLSTRMVSFLGQASYSMYILHIPLLWWFKRCWLYRSQIMPAPAAGVLFVIAVIAVSGIVFRVFEEPANRCLRKLLTARLAA